MSEDYSLDWMAERLEFSASKTLQNSHARKVLGTITPRFKREATAWCRRRGGARQAWRGEATAGAERRGGAGERAGGRGRGQASPKRRVGLHVLHVPGRPYLCLTRARKVLWAPAAGPGTTYAFLSSPLWDTCESGEGAVRPTCGVTFPGPREGGSRASHRGPERQHPCARGGAGAGHVLVPRLESLR